MDHGADAAHTTVTATGINRLLTFNRQRLDPCWATDSLQENIVLAQAGLASRLPI